MTTQNQPVSFCPPRRQPAGFRRALLGPLLGAVLALPWVSPVAADAAAMAWPQDIDQIQTTRDVVNIMQNKHFRKVTLDDAFSSKLLDSYLKALDPNRQIFLQSDIDEFAAYRNLLDDELQIGQLNSARKIYQRYYERYTARLQWLIGQVEPVVTRNDFSGHDVIEIDRKDSPWPKDMKEADDLWLRFVRNAVLSLQLSDKPQGEITTTLTRRFRNQLDRLQKLTGMDSYELFMNTYTAMYDPHTNYMSPKSAQNFDISMSLSMEGIGAVLEKDDEYTKVVRLVPAGPAAKQGELAAGDRIIAISQGKNSKEWVDVIGWRLDEVVDLVRGPSDSWVTLQIKRGENEIRTVSIHRDKVKLEDQEASKRIIDVRNGDTQYRIGVIRVPGFYLDFEALRRHDPDAKSTTRDVRKLLDELRVAKVDGIMIDLRDNGGGSLIEANQLTNLFIDPGPVVQILNADNEVERNNRATQPAYYNGPLLVLIDHYSASASEIFAGALQDYQRALIVGEQSFGKGTVQTLLPLRDGRLKITQSKFYRVSGESTQHRGVVPDITYPPTVPLDEVGESALENALPWDTIKPAPHYLCPDIRSFIPALQQAHEKRMQGNPDYLFLQKQISFSDQQRKRKALPLNRELRQQQQKTDEATLLQMTNELRATKGQPPLKTLSELDALNQKKRDEKNPQDDFLLQESGNILGDFISLQSRQRPVVGQQVKPLWRS